MASNIRIRMYRTGFGDCFLVSFGAASTARHVLIDFGAHAQGEIGTMEPIMDNLESTTGRKLEVLVATHAHRDHISGFGKFADRFAQFEIGEVWLPWTDNPKDKDATALQRKHLALYDRLENHLHAAAGSHHSDPFQAEALHALSNLRGNEVATSELGRAFGTGAKVRYLGAGKSFAKVSALAGLSAEILGPPMDKKFFSRMDPPDNQRLLTAPSLVANAVRPFERLEIRRGDPDFQAISNEGQPLVPDGEEVKLHSLAEAPAGRLALLLDNVRNNTSLVIVFRFRGKTLLFPGDAQWGSWQSWIGTESSSQLLGEVDFFKVAHHGSQNATPADVVKALKAAGLAAMVPTQVTPFPTIPRKPLLTEIERHCAGHVAVRSDWIQVDNAPSGPKPRLPKGFKPGEVWIDYSL